MKLATYKDGSRDGQLVVVSRDLGSAHYATGIANSLQQVLDDWAYLAPLLQDLSVQLNAGRARHAFAFDPRQCMAPLPRAYQWIEAQAYPPIGPAAESAHPLLQQGASDDLSGACDDLVATSQALELDFAAGLAVVTGDVARASSSEAALAEIRLLMLANSVCLHALIGNGYLPSHPNTAFSPVAVTPDELGDAWQKGRVHLTLQTLCNGRKVGLCDTGPAMRWDFGQLIAYAARARQLRAGSIIGSGAVRPAASPSKAKSRNHWAQGYCSIADKRAQEILQDGQAQTPFLQFGDSIRIDLKGKDGHSVCGAIDQNVTPASPFP